RPPRGRRRQRRRAPAALTDHHVGAAGPHAARLLRSLLRQRASGDADAADHHERDPEDTGVLALVRHPDAALADRERGVADLQHFIAATDLEHAGEHQHARDRQDGANDKESYPHTGSPRARRRLAGSQSLVRLRDGTVSVGALPQPALPWIPPRVSAAASSRRLSSPSSSPLSSSATSNTGRFSAYARLAIAAPFS